MTNKNSFKKTLILSCITLALSVIIIVGSTLAWFTGNSILDDASITSGKLDVVLEMWDGEAWVDAEKTELKFVTPDNREEVLWEPNCTYQLPKIRVRNVGNVTVNFLLRLDGIHGDEKLLEAIEFTTIVSNAPDSLTDWESTYSPIFGTVDGNLLFYWTLAAEGKEPLKSGHTDVSPEFVLQGHMKKEAGNEFKGMTLDGMYISAVASQRNYVFEIFK